MTATRCLAAAVALVAAWSASSAATRYCGRITDEEGQPVEDVRIHFQEVGDRVVGKGGEFVVEIDERRLPIALSVEPRTRYRVVAPIGASIDRLTPGDRIQIVVAPSYNHVVMEAIVDSSARLLDALTRLGHEVKDSHAILDGELREILERNHRTEDEFLGEVERRRQRTGFLADIAPPFERYLREVKDLRDAFELVGPYAAEDPAALGTLVRAMTEYSGAFATLNDRRDAYLGIVKGFGAGESVEGLHHDLDGVLVKALDEIHRERVLSLNEALVTLQRSHGAKPPDRGSVVAATSRVVQASKDLRPAIGNLEDAWKRFTVRLLGTS